MWQMTQTVGATVYYHHTDGAIPDPFSQSGIEESVIPGSRQDYRLAEIYQHVWKNCKFSLPHQSTWQMKIT